MRDDCAGSPDALHEVYAVRGLAVLDESLSKNREGEDAELFREPERW